MISRRTCSIPKGEGFPRLHYRDSRCLQTCHWRFRTCCTHSQVLPGAPKVLSGSLRCTQTYYNHCHGTPVQVNGDLSDFEGRPECPPTIGFSPKIYSSKFTLHILSDTSGGSQRLKYILLMFHINRGSKVKPERHSPYQMSYFESLEVEYLACNNTGQLQGYWQPLLIYSTSDHDYQNI
jgi:hypothetical protein